MIQVRVYAITFLTSSLVGGASQPDESNMDKHLDEAL
jgi:hypothetical protein